MKLVDNRTNDALEDNAFGDEDVILITLHRIAAVPIKKLEDTNYATDREPKAATTFIYT